MVKKVGRPLVYGKMHCISQDSWSGLLSTFPVFFSRSFPIISCSSGQSGYPIQLSDLGCAVVSLRALACAIFLTLGFLFPLLSESLFYFCKQFPVFFGLCGSFFSRALHPLLMSLLQLYEFIALIVFWTAWGQRLFLVPWCINACRMNEWKTWK